MVIIPGLTQPLEAVGKQITTYNDSGKRLAVQACSVVDRAPCPKCAWSSSRIHGRCQRQIADCPCFGQPVTLEIEVRRFKSVNRHCPQRTFCEQINCLAGPRQRRTLRLSKTTLALGYALGGAAAARLGAHLGIHLSGTTVLRELRRAGCAPMVTSSTIIGIDDWAISRGHRYGTIVVDLQRRCPIELLSGREVATVVPWLKAQSGVEVIARDRAGAYADAARTGAPAAQQVADRWHLLANLRDAIERLLVRCASQMKEAARHASKPLVLAGEPAEVAVAAGSQDVDEAQPLKGGQRRSSERRALRLARYEEVLRRHEAGQSIRAIGRAMDLDRRTVRGFLHAGAFPERSQRRTVVSLLDAHRSYMAARASEGCRNATEIWHALRARGFTGGHSIVRTAFAQLRGEQPDRLGSTDSPDHSWFREHVVAAPSTRRACAWVLDWRGNKHVAMEQTGKDPSERQRFVEALCRIAPAVDTARHRAHQFLT